MAQVCKPRDLGQIVMDGLGALVFAFGYKTGIVDAFGEVEQPCTAEELSQKAGKKLRYVTNDSLVNIRAILQVKEVMFVYIMKCAFYRIFKHFLSIPSMNHEDAY